MSARQIGNFHRAICGIVTRLEEMEERIGQYDKALRDVDDLKVVRLMLLKQVNDLQGTIISQKCEIRGMQERIEQMLRDDLRAQGGRTPAEDISTFNTLRAQGGSTPAEDISTLDNFRGEW